jgi:hypothetical protein
LDLDLNQNKSFLRGSPRFCAVLVSAVTELRAKTLANWLVGKLFDQKARYLVS